MQCKLNLNPILHIVYRKKWAYRTIISPFLLGPSDLTEYWCRIYKFCLVIVFEKYDTFVNVICLCSVRQQNRARS